MRADLTHPGLAGAVVLAIAFVGNAACGDDFDPYNLVNRDMRILAIRADPPWVTPGGVATVEPLIYVAEGAEAPELSWSWCPAVANGECAVTAADVGEALGVEGLSFELGDGPTVDFPYPAPQSNTSSLCESLLAGEWPPFLERPDCDEGITISIQLDAVAVDIEETAFKEVRLSLDDETHENPSLLGIQAAVDDPDDDVEPESYLELDPAGTTTLALGESYRVVVDIPEAAAEPYVDPETGEETFESLALTYLVTVGETDDTRTRWYVDDTDDSGRRTVWTLPDDEDTDETEATLIIVARDGRGGLGWLERTVRLEP